jgi:hypothetical protein
MEDATMMMLWTVLGIAVALAVVLAGTFAKAQREADEIREAARRRRQMIVESIERPVPDVRRFQRMRRERRLETLRRHYGRRAGGSAA